MIWDSFLYNGEERLLQIRLHELAPVVDGFFIVEGHVTHQGKPKHPPWYMAPYGLRSTRDLYKDYNIRFLGVSLPNVGDITEQEAAENEIAQRNATAKCGKPDDIMIMSDVDEIPSREVIEKLKWRFENLPDSKPVKVKVSTCYYYLNQAGPAPFTEYGPMVAKVSDAIRATPQILRACLYSPDMPSIDGGWHFTYLGDIEKKMNEVAHHNEDHKSKYERAITRHVGKLEVITSLPHLVREQPEKFRDWLINTQGLHGYQGSSLWSN